MRPLLAVALAFATLILAADLARAADWAPAPHSSVSGRSLVFEAMDAAGDDDVWVAGYDYGTIGGALEFRTVIHHWDGVSWTRVPTPDRETAPAANRLLDISSPAADRAWAVGRSATALGDPRSRALLLRWDGTRWAIVEGPEPGAGAISSVVASPGGTIWLSGPGMNPESGYEYPLVWRKVATGWARVPFPAIPGCRTTANGLPYRAVLNDLGMRELARSYAVGTCVAVDGQERGWLAHFDGSAWRPLVTPTDFAAQGARGSLEGVSMSPSGEVWAVGGADDHAVSYRGRGAQVYPVAVPRQGQSSALAAVDAERDGEAVAAGTYLATDVLPRLNLTSTLPRWRGWGLDAALSGIYGNLRAVAIEPSGRAWAAGVSSSDDRGLLLRRFVPPPVN